MTRSDMPRRVYLKHGAYYFVTLENKWVRLSAARDGLPAMYRALAAISDKELNQDCMPAVIARWLDSKRGDWVSKTEIDMERACRLIASAFQEFRPAEVTTPAC